MSNIHAALGAYRAAVDAYEIAAAVASAALDEVRARAGALPPEVQPIVFEKLADGRPAGLAEHTRDIVIPAAKGAN